MASDTLGQPLSAAEKQARYETLAKELSAVLAGESNQTARMATVACLAAQAFPENYFWTGFYLVDPKKPEELVVGPYQGSLGCLRIPFGKGVCGMAAQTGETQVVEDVHALANHIACDARSNSEIVVPVHDASGDLIAVFDVDSEALAAFDAVDKTHLESILKELFGTS